MTADVLRLSAFADGDRGGNPAGVVLDARPLDPETMQSIAARVGYAETAFIVQHAVDGEQRHVRVRYFSPGAEVPFCGHATIAMAVALAERDGVGPYTFDTNIGAVAVDTSRAPNGSVLAAFTSVEPELRELDSAAGDELLTLLGLASDDLDPRYPLAESYAGNWHPIVAVRAQDVFDSFSFDPTSVRRLMDRRGWRGTVTVVHQSGAAADTESAEAPAQELSFEARNLFPVGSLTEDPATGSAAASLGGYLRAIGAVAPPARVTVRQGRHIGQPCLLVAEVPQTGGIVVSGTAAPIHDPGT